MSSRGQKQQDRSVRVSYAAMVVALVALVSSTAGAATAVSIKGPSTKPRPYGVLALNKKKKFPASAIPTVNNAKRLGNKPASSYKEGCASDSVDMGTWCIMEEPYIVEPEDESRSNYFFATRACAAIGGWLPSADELIGAVDRIRIPSTIDDNNSSAVVDQDPIDGLKDRREMSSTLVTTASGSNAAGSIGVTAGSRGNPQLGESDPVQRPADPQPQDLQYVTVYDNKDQGGFAGSKPVAQPERFRCAFDQVQKRDQRKVRGLR